jgi:hypothetical protein
VCSAKRLELDIILLQSVSKLVGFMLFFFQTWYHICLV